MLKTFLLRRRQPRILPLRAVFLLLQMMLLLSFFPASAFAAPGYDQVGKATIKDVGSAAMVPVYPDAILDGTYEIEVQSSSSFFKIEKVLLTVADGEMSATLYMYSYSYSLVYPGTAEEAAAASEEDYIAAERIDYYDTFTIPVQALDQSIDLAAFSKKKEKWYDRKLVFLASSLPSEALAFSLPDYNLIDEALEAYEELYPERFTEALEDTSASDEEPEAVSVDMADGDYSIEVSLSGGSGRASVTSPTWFYVKDGQAYAKLLWSSSYYDYMLLDGVRYLNETTDGSNSTFTIPVTAMDQPVTVTADTTAMGEPVEIEYTLTFYADTIGNKSAVPQEGAKMVVLIALIVMIGGGLLNYLLKHRSR